LLFNSPSGATTNSREANCRMALSWFNWFYNEFGLGSIQATGRNAYLIITARTMRMISFGMTQVMLGKPSLLLDIKPELMTSQPCSLPSSISPTFESVCS
jgi:hypothetical protein